MIDYLAAAKDALEHIASRNEYNNNDLVVLSEIIKVLIDEVITLSQQTRESGRH